MKNLIRDRPRMAKYVTPGDPVWKWFVEQFAGEGIGRRIYWENTIPSHGAAGMSHPHQYGGNDAIRIRNEEGTGPLAGELQCAIAVYELLNIRNHPEFNSANIKYLDTKPSNTQLTAKPRKEWIERNTQIEYNTLLSARSFYYLVWRPSMQAKKIQTEERWWRTNIAYPYPAWLKSEDALPFIEYWGKAYDDWHH